MTVDATRPDHRTAVGKRRRVAEGARGTADGRRGGSGARRCAARGDRPEGRAGTHAVHTRPPPGTCWRSDPQTPVPGSARAALSGAANSTALPTLLAERGRRARARTP